MEVKCVISLGELVDKISVLKIKEKKINDLNKVANVKKELGILEGILDNLNVDGIDSYTEDLESINEYLWIVIDKMRVHEKEENFDEEFIRLAREVYKNNDKRFFVKHEINKKYGSLIKEEKNI